MNSARKEKSGNTGGSTPQKAKPVSKSAGANGWRGGIKKDTRGTRSAPGNGPRKLQSGNTG